MAIAKVTKVAQALTRQRVNRLLASTCMFVIGRVHNDTTGVLV